jgi:diacylglycerol kinase family enzyme
VRVCIIFNPAARGERATEFLGFLSSLGEGVELRPTTGAGAARFLAREAAEAGFDRVVAAGGDGTVFEVLNGLLDGEGSRPSLGVLPLGTANVLARELGMPRSLPEAWRWLVSGVERWVDVGWAEFQGPDGQPGHGHFSIVAGAGLDARAVLGVGWKAKKRWGKLAYVVSALRAAVAREDRVATVLAGEAFVGRAVLVGNGRLYAGEMAMFPGGRLGSGRLEVRGLVSVTPGVVWGALWSWVTGRWVLDGSLVRDAVTELRLEPGGKTPVPVPLQLDGEWVGWLPATVRVKTGALRLVMAARQR